MGTYSLFRALLPFFTIPIIVILITLALEFYQKLNKKGKNIVYIIFIGGLILSMGLCFYTSYLFSVNICKDDCYSLGTEFYKKDLLSSYEDPRTKKSLSGSGCFCKFKDGEIREIRNMKWFTDYEILRLKNNGSRILDKEETLYFLLKNESNFIKSNI